MQTTVSAPSAAGAAGFGAGAGDAVEALSRSVERTVARAERSGRRRCATTGNRSSLTRLASLARLRRRRARRREDRDDDTRDEERDRARERSNDPRRRAAL